MPRLERFEIEIKTGSVGTQGVPRFAFNGFVMELDDVVGSTGPGETLRGSFEPRSFTHQLVLHGPDRGQWEIETIRMAYELEGGQRYDVRFGRVMLDETNAVNIWRPPPLLTFDV